MDDTDIEIETDGIDDANIEISIDADADEASAGGFSTEARVFARLYGAKDDGAFVAVTTGSNFDPETGELWNALTDPRSERPDDDTGFPLWRLTRGVSLSSLESWIPGDVESVVAESPLFVQLDNLNSGPQVFINADAASTDAWPEAGLGISKPGTIGTEFEDWEQVHPDDLITPADDVVGLES